MAEFEIETVDPNKEKPKANCPNCQTPHTSQNCRNCGCDEPSENFFICPACDQRGMTWSWDTQKPEGEAKADCNNCDYSVEVKGEPMALS